jgi:hypothetical protein
MPGTPANDLNITQSGLVTFDGVATFLGRTLTAGTGITITNGNGVSGNPTIATTASLVDLHTAKWIVNPLGSIAGANSTTIQSAINQAVSGDTIFIMPATYTENLTLKAGVNLTAFGCDQDVNHVIVVGKMTFTSAGTVSISGIRLQTNSDFFLAVTGSAASTVNLNNCYLNCLNNTGISYTSSSGSSAININYCLGNLGTTGIGLFSMSSSGNLQINWSMITNTGASTTSSTASAGTVNINASYFNSAFTISSTALINIIGCDLDCSAINTTALTVNGSGNGACYFSILSSGTASAITGSQAFAIHSCTIISSNTNAITGAGSITYSGLTFPSGFSSLINTTTQSGGTLIGGKNGVAPAAGFLGEVITSTVLNGSATSLVTNTAKTVTSINLTSGTWCISACLGLAGTTQTQNVISISTTNNTIGGNFGADSFSTPISASAASDASLSIPSFFVSISTTTTYYLIARSTFTGTASAYGNIRAVRVG